MQIYLDKEKQTQKFRMVSIKPNTNDEIREQYEKFLQNSIIQFEWMKRQIDYSLFALRARPRFDLKKGDILEIDWGYNINAEFSNRHYGVVLVDSHENNPLVMVCPLKTSHKPAHPRSDLDLGIIPGLKNNEHTIAVINQIRTVDKIRLYTKQIINYNMDDYVDLSISEGKVDLIIDYYIMLLKTNGFKE